MKRLVKKICVFGMMICSSAAVFAYSAKDVLDSKVYESLQKNTFVTTNSFGQKNYKLSYLPKTDLCKKIAGYWDKDENPTYVCEYLYLLPKKQDIAYSSKVLRSVSKMQGIQYYSHSHKKTETLYKECYCVKGADDYTKVADPTDGSADGKTVYCMQDDNSLGKIYYRLNYRQTADEVSVGFTNISPITVMFIKALDKNDLKLNMVITDCGDEVLLYVVGRAKFPEMSVLENRMNESISARVEALYKWYISQF